MALAAEKDKRDEELDDLPQDDGKDHLRADVMGSMVKNDPSSPAYLGKMDSYITAHGALSKPTMPSSRMTSAEAPDLGGSLSPTDMRADVPSPMMNPARPKQGWLGKIGSVAKSMGNIAGDIFAPSAMAMIPGTDLNKRIEAARKEKTAERQRQLTTEETKAGAEKERAETEAAKEKFAERQPPVGKTPEETTLHDLMTGENGQPRINPDTGKPYQYLEAYQAVNQAKQDTKPQKEPNTVEGVRKDLLDAMRSGDKDKIATLGGQLEKLSDPGGDKEAMRQLQMELARQRIQEKNAKDTALSPQAQEILMSTEPTLQQVDQLLADLEPLKNDNKSRLTLDRIGYALGNASPKGTLAADISKLELDRVVAGARVLKGSSRAYQALELAMKHAPNSWIDTPNLMYDKLKNIRQNLADVIEDAKKFGVKNLPASTKTGTEKTGGKITSEPLTLDEAKEYLEKAGGDKKKARALAKKDGRKF